MQSQDFTAVLEITDENLIKKLDKLEELKSNDETQIGVFDCLNKKMKLKICKDTFKLKLEKPKRSRQNMIIEIDNIEYVDYSNYIDHLKEFKKHSNKKLNKFLLKGIIEKQKEEHKKRIQQSKILNMKKNLNLGKSKKKLTFRG